MQAKQHSEFHSLTARSLALEHIPAILWTADTGLRFTAIAGSGLHWRGDGEWDGYLGTSVTGFFPHAASELSPIEAHQKALRGIAVRFYAEVGGRVLQANLEPIRSSNGEILGVAGAAIDSTERSVAESALRLSEQSYRLLIEEAPYGICRATVSGQLLQVNRAMVEMLAYDSEADLLLCSMAADIFCELPEFHEFLKRFGGPASRYGFESKWRCADGQAIFVSLGGRAVRDRHGRVSFFEIIAENITERKQLEIQLRQAQKMQAVGQLAGGIAHDFNNLLTVIKGQLELVLSDMPPDGNIRPRLEEVEHAADKAATLTRQLLAFGRMQPVQSRSLNLNVVMGNLVQLLTRLIGEKITLVFLPGARLHFVHADPGQIEQVLMNLAVNARDAMPEGGKLTISTMNARLAPASGTSLEGADQEEYVALVVTDTGYGMNAETQSRIYEPFFTTKSLGQGTGLGLFTVYGIVKQSKGHIDAESEPGKGAKFTVYFPAVSEQIEAPRPATATVLPGGTETILIAEDERPIRELFTSFLTKLGYRVLSAADGAEALKVSAECGHKIDLLLTDVTMPRLGGVELMRRICDDGPGVKVIFMSGYAGDQATMHAIQTSGCMILQKPFSSLYLARTIRNVLDGIDPGLI